MKTYLKITLFFFCVGMVLPPIAHAEGAQAAASTATITTSADRGLIAWGTVDSVTANQVVIRDQNKEMTPYVLSDQTLYEGMTLEDLKVGADVKLEYGPADNVVNRISLKPAE